MDGSGETIDPRLGRPEDLGSLEELGSLKDLEWLRRLARRLLQSSHDAEDLVQETWLVALKNHQTRRGEFSHWLSGIGRNLARQKYRGQERRHRRERSVAKQERVDVDPLRLTMEAEAHREIVTAVLELEERDRMMVLLRFFRDMTPREIAQHLSVPPSRVRTQPLPSLGSASAINWRSGILIHGGLYS